MSKQNHNKSRFAGMYATALNIADYQAGWYLCAQKKSIYLCTNDHQRDGWIASANAHAAMVTVGVRT